MLKRVCFLLKYVGEEERQIIKKKLEQDGLETCFLFEMKEPLETEVLLVTDCCEGELWAVQRSCPCLGIEIKERLHCRYVYQDWKWISSFYLERIYRRYCEIPWDIFETKRCLVREMTTDDMEAMYALYKDKEITRYVEPLYEDREREKAYIIEHIKHMYGFFEYGMWLVLDKENGQLIGRVGICNREINGCAEPELGYVIGKSYQRQGYGLEVCQQVLSYAKEELGLEFLNCFVEEENLPSIALAEKLGFQKNQEEKINNLFWYRKNL